MRIDSDESLVRSALSSRAGAAALRGWQNLRAITERRIADSADMRFRNPLLSGGRAMGWRAEGRDSLGLQALRVLGVEVRGGRDVF
jgi:hypothetical protein